MSSESEVPEERCGFVLEPGDVPEHGQAVPVWMPLLRRVKDYEPGSDWWYFDTEAVCCWRRAWDGSDGDRCIWHAETDEKPADELVGARSNVPERLDGVYLPAVKLGDAIDFEECGLQAATFDGTGVEEASFKGIDGQFAQFPDASLGWAEFPDADLRHAQFPDATLQGTEFPDANLRWAGFPEATLQGAEFPCASLLGAEFRDANLREAEFPGANLLGAEFPDADLEAAQFSDTNLVEAQFPDATLQGAEFPNADLEATQFPDTDLVKAQFPDADLREAEFSGAILREAQFPDADLRRAQFPDADLVEAEFSGATLQEAEFPDADLETAQFSDADLEEAQFSGATLREAQFPDANLRRAQFPDSDLVEAEFSGATLRETQFPGADLRRAQFPDADLVEAEFPDADLRRAQFPDADLRATNFEGATMYLFAITDETTNFDATTVFGWSHHEPNERWAAAARAYRAFHQTLREHAMPTAVRRYRVREMHMRRKATFPDNPVEWAKLALARWTTLYGESPWRVGFTSLAVVLGSAVLYQLVGPIARPPSPDGTTIVGGDLVSTVPMTLPGWLSEFLTSVYFSVVTFTTLGYGDLQPATPTAQLLATVESFVGALLMALLVYVLARRTTW